MTLVYVSLPMIQKYTFTIATRLTLPVMMMNAATLLEILTNLFFKMSRLQLGITLLSLTVMVLMKAIMSLLLTIHHLDHTHTI